MRQLDSLRAVAFAFVLIEHYVPGDWPWSPWMNGHIGVHLFFAISGFLITGILLDARGRAETIPQQRTGVLGRFYVRRFLRIFPLFYATLALTYVAGFPEVRQSIAWHLTYASNFFFFIRGAWFGQTSHFWSLAVEEQFYLLWPFLILFVPRKVIVPLLVTLILSASVFRYVGEFALGWNDVRREVLTPACIDSLAFGALFAWLKRADEIRAHRMARVLAMSAVPLWIIGAGVTTHWFPAALQLVRPLHAPALASIVYFVSNGFRGFVGRVLSLGPLVYLGRISYGLYVFHLFVPLVVRSVLRRGFHIVLQPDGVVATLTYTLVLIAAASVSWQLFESPLNGLKRYFPYVSADTRASAGVAESHP